LRFEAQANPRISRSEEEKALKNAFTTERSEKFFKLFQQIPIANKILTFFVESLAFPYSK